MVHNFSFIDFCKAGGFVGVIRGRGPRRTRWVHSRWIFDGGLLVNSGGVPLLHKKMVVPRMVAVDGCCGPASVQ